MDLLSAAFSAMLGVEVVPLDKAPESDVQAVTKLSVHDLFRATHFIGDMQSGVPGLEAASPEAAGPQIFDINIRTLTGTRIVVPVTKDHTIAQVKAAVRAKSDIPISNQRLIFNSNVLSDDHTIGGSGILPQGHCFLIIIDGKDVTKTKFLLDPSDLAPEYDYDFTNVRDSDSSTYYRGDFEYKRPCGWRRFAIKVKGRSEYGSDDTWLGPNGIRTASAPKEWPVCYHGTAADACGGVDGKGIVRHGYDPKRSERELYGPGIYCSPSIEGVGDLRYRYAKKFSSNGKSYKVVLQNRVNPEKIGHQIKSDNVNNSTSHQSDPYKDCSLVIIDQNGPPFKYWRCPRHDPDKDIYDIRPYGILIREV
jgi:hypothetical protein